MKDRKIPVQVLRTAFGNEYRCLIRPALKPAALIPLLHITQSHFDDAASRDGGRISVYRMGGVQALEIRHKELPWVERMERDVVSRIQEVARWMKDKAAARAR